jgi:hypothetical protein
MSHRQDSDTDQQDVIPYVVSDFLSWLLPSILSPLCYILLVYFIAGLREDDLAANLFTIVASVRLSLLPRTAESC